MFVDQANTANLTPETMFPSLTGELELALVYSVEGLDPLQDHTMGIRQVPDPSRGDTWIILDHIVVTQTTLDARLAALLR